MKAAIGSATGEPAVKARTAIIATIEKAGCPDTATTRCQVVTLYGGGQYKLYTYRKYSRCPHRLGARGRGLDLWRRSR